MAKIDLSKYGITGTTEVVYNPSYEMLFEEETKPELEGFEKGQVSELGAYLRITVCPGRADSVYWSQQTLERMRFPCRLPIRAGRYCCRI